MIGHLLRYLRVGSPAWAVRRRITVLILLAAFTVILFQALFGTDTPRVLGLVDKMVNLIEWTLGVYVGAATAETATQTLRGQPPA
jgi:hypothetical protein